MIAPGSIDPSILGAHMPYELPPDMSDLIRDEMNVLEQAQ